MANNNHTANPLKLQSTVLIITVRGETREYLYTRITNRCHVLTSVKTGATRQFRSAETLWAFFAALIKHISSKPTANQDKAIGDFLSSAEAYFKQFSQIINSKVGNYTRSGMQWQLRNAELAAGAAASRYAQFVSQGI
jgi:hypothetical protein